MPIHLKLKTQYFPPNWMVGWVKSTQVAATTKSKEPMLENSKGVTNSLREASESVVASSWVTHYNELVNYKREFGNCCVPFGYKTNPTLGRWVNWQRRQFKSNQLAEHRIEKLNEIGFASWGGELQLKIGSGCHTTTNLSSISRRYEIVVCLRSTKQTLNWDVGLFSA